MLDVKHFHFSYSTQRESRRYEILHYTSGVQLYIQERAQTIDH